MTAVLNPRAFSVATYNLYQGAGTIPAYAAGSLPEMVDALRAAVDTMRRTDFPARAAALAAQLAGERPDLLGLQEVARWQHGERTDDFLDIMLAALAGAGVPYRTLMTSLTTPLALHTDGEIVGVTDRIALLARADLPDAVTVDANGQQTYQARIELPVPSGLVVTKTRGWVWADVRVGGRPVRVVTTHLEAFDPDVRLAQSGELVEALDGAGRPAIVMGDLNSSPEDEAYLLLRKNGFRDAWVDAHGDTDGFTGVRGDIDADDLSALYQRYDYVMHRGSGLRTSAATLLGADASVRLPSGLWPSDHAGLAVTLDVTAG